MFMSKKLLQINVTANWGSTGKITEQIGLLAMSYGWESYIAYGRMMNPSKSKLIKIGNSLEVYIHYALSRFLDMEGLASRRATRKLIRDIEQIEPNVVHLHNIHDHYLNYPILFEYLASHDIPVVWTQHDQWATTGHCAFNIVGCERWKSECRDCPVKERSSLDLCNRNFNLKKKYFTSLKNATIVTVSDWLKTQIEQSYLGKYPIKVIKNGVDINVFKPQDTDIKRKYGIGNNKFILGVAHPWSERKALKDYIELSKLLPKGCIVVLVGLNDKQRLNLPENIKGLGATQNLSELVMLYSMADVVLNLSYAETFGLTTVEGFACGTPSVVYNATASPELVTPETGFIVEPGNIGGVRDAVISIMKNGKNFYSRACVERAKCYFSSSDKYHEYINLYEELIKL